MSYQRRVFWGIVPYTPAAPFSVKLLRTFDEFATAGDLVREMKRQDAAGELPFSVLAKIRPLLAISEPSVELRDITALRLANITRRVNSRHLTEAEAAEITNGDHPYLFYLRPEVTSSLTRTNETYAAVVDNPITLNQSAITTAAVGEINEHEFSMLCQRLVESLGFDLTMLIDARTRELAVRADTEDEGV